MPAVSASAPSVAPFRFGLPPRETLEGYRIWDSYFTPSHSSPGRGSARIFTDMERSLPAIEKGAIERLCYFPHVGLGTADAETDAWLRERPEEVTLPLERWPGRLLGMIQLNANDVAGSLEALDRWLRDGPMVGVYFPGGGRAALTCNHPNFHPLVERVAELGGVIMQHTWIKSGGKDSPGESTPSELGELAARYPDIPFIAAHAGGEWEQGIRAAREFPNILVETSGFDPTAGFIEMAARELGAERVIFGSHLPSRSLGTELGKVTAASITEAEKRLILGENFRRLLEPMLRSKGLQ